MERRPNGYCLNVLARALARQLHIIPLMVARLDFREPAHYDARFAQLLDALDHHRLDFTGAQARLRAILQPIDYDEPARHLARFTGREWVNREVEQWLAARADQPTNESHDSPAWIPGDNGPSRQ